MNPFFLLLSIAPVIAFAAASGKTNLSILGEDFYESRCFSLGLSAAECGATPWSVYGLRRNLARDLRDYLGAEAIEDSVRVPSWRGNITAFREKVACRHSL